MKRPKLIELEFAMLLFLIGGAFVHGILMGLFSLGKSAASLG